MRGHLGFPCRTCLRPGAPENLRQSGTGTVGGTYQATLAWDAPSVVGGGPVLEYRVERATSLDASSWVIVDGTDAAIRTAAVAWCLEGGIFRVVARNRCGWGEPSSQFGSWTFAPGGTVVLLTASTTFAPPCWATSVKVWCVGCGGTDTSGGAAGGLAWKTWTRSPGDSWGGDFTAVVRNAPDGALLPLSSVAHGGTTVIGYGAQLTNNGTATGGDGGATGISGGTGYPITYDGWTGSYKYGGAIGGWSGTDETGAPILLPPVSPCQRRPALNRAGLFAAVELLGLSVVEDCDEDAAFGSGGVTFAVPNYGGDVRVDFTPGYGGGGFDATNPGGPGCVVVQYS